MTRTKSTERMSLSYERVVERTTDDAPEHDPRPSFPPMRVVTTDGETVDECTIPLEGPARLAKCAPLVRTLRKVG